MSPAENLTSQSIDVLTVEECENVAAEITQMKSHWIQRDTPDFYTLAAASYLDSPDPLTHSLPAPDPAHYYQLSAQLNPLLLDRLAPMYESVRQAIQAALGQDARYYTKCAVPGFHIYLDHDFYSANQAHVPHVDRQYRGIIWDDVDSLAFETAISFTLPIELPASGGGLYLWDINLYDIEHWDKEQAKDAIRDAKQHKQNYTPGSLFLHRGHLLHRAAPWAVEHGDRRITLQGHGLFFDNAWQLYW